MAEEYVESVSATAAVEAEKAPQKPKRRRTKKASESAEPAEASAAEGGEEPKKPRKRATRKKKSDEGEVAEPVSESGEDVAEKPKAKRTRARKATSKKEGAATKEEAAAEPKGDSEPVAQGAAEDAEALKKKARRSRKATKDKGEDSAESESASAAETEPAGGEGSDKKVPSKTRSRRKKVSSAEGEELDVEKLNKLTQDATHASSQVQDAPATTLGEADGAARPASASKGEDDGRKGHGKQEGEGRRRHKRGERDRDRDQNSRNDFGGKRQGRSQRRRNRRNQQEVLEPSLSREELEGMKVVELRSKAAELGVDHVGARKAELVDSIYRAAALAEGFRPVEGVLDFQNEGYAYVRTGNYMTGESDAFVHQQVIRQYGLRPGDWIKGSVAPSKGNNKYPPLNKVELVNGHAPEEMKSRARFRDLTPIYPNVRLTMEHGRESITGRAIDLVAPIGKGQRGLIVSPPKAGKTTVLKKICQSIAANNPEVHLFCLLVDERPEEVTDMERSIRGEVVASTFDMPASNHTAVAELVIERAKRLVELGEDVVVVLDSITRLARAYNLAQPASGRILSGGVDSAALYPPKKFLGAARNIENGGSLTILASALVDTGSKMDEVIFEEFKGTGNMELKLDRELADRRIFPAIDPVSSGTRNEDLLIDAELQPFVWGIRRILANMNSTERAASALVKGLKGTKDNEEFLIRSAKKAQQTEYFGA